MKLPRIIAKLGNNKFCPGFNFFLEFSILAHQFRLKFLEWGDAGAGIKISCRQFNGFTHGFMFKTLVHLFNQAQNVGRVEIKNRFCQPFKGVGTGVVTGQDKHIFDSFSSHAAEQALNFTSVFIATGQVNQWFHTGFFDLDTKHFG